MNTSPAPACAGGGAYYAEIVFPESGPGPLGCPGMTRVCGAVKMEMPAPDQGVIARRDEIAAALRRCAADVLVIDDRLLRNHDRLLTSVGADRAGIRVIVLGVDDDPGFSARARRLGAEAWVAKDRAGDELPALLGD